MPEPITCPACGASFTRAQDLRGRRAFCKKCGQPLIVTAAGVVKRGESARPNGAARPGGKGRMVLLLAAAVLLAGIAVTLAVLAFSDGRHEEPPPLAGAPAGTPPGGQPSPAVQAPSPDRAGAVEGGQPDVQPADAAAPQTDLPGKGHGKGKKEGPFVTLPPVRPRGPATESARKLVTLRHQGLFYLAFSPDSKMLATAGRDKTIKLWDVASGANTAALAVPNEYGMCVAFSPDDKTLASGGSEDGQGKDFKVRLWDVASRTNTATLAGHTSTPLSVAFSPDGKLLASSTYGNGSSGAAVYAEIKLWEVAGGKELRTIKMPAVAQSNFGGARTVAFSPDGKMLAGCSPDYTIRLWDVAMGKQVQLLKGFTTPSLCLGFSPDGKSLFASLMEQKVGIWDLASGKLARTLETRAFGDVAISPDGKTLAVANGGNGVGLWDLATGQNIGNLPVNEKGITVFWVVFSPDGRTLAAGGLGPGPVGGVVQLWDESARKADAPPKR
jgi:Tol biopolymer transport system component